MNKENNNNPKPSSGMPISKPGGRPQGGRPQGRGNTPNNRPKTEIKSNLSTSRGQAIRASRRNSEFAQKMADEYSNASSKQGERKANSLTASDQQVKITFLGGMNDVGEKNTTVIEYQNDAIILDCGMNLGVDLPGINYEIVDPSYIETIKHKIKAYVVTHGHLDHVGGLKHLVPKYPAPIYGSNFSMGIIEKSFADVPQGTEMFKPQLETVNLDNHDKLKIGAFDIEFIRITHSIPEAGSIAIGTPVGKIIATGDYRLDPEPLDEKPSDTKRLKELGDEGVLMLLTESSYSDEEGRTPTEHTLQQSFIDVIKSSQGRIFCAVFSSNMNRIQMIINAAVEDGRKIVLDGRSMMAYAEIAVRQGLLRVPKGTFVPMKSSGSIPDDQLLIMATGGQGEPNAALQRMSEGTHNHIKLKAGDTVLVSSSPIPGNEVRYDMIGNNLSKMGVHLYRHPTHEIDGCGPLHVSGHARRDEMREMIQLTRPKFIIPNHGGHLRRKYHAELAVEEGWDRKNVVLANNGDSYVFSKDKIEPAGEVPHGSLLVDQSGSIVNNIVVKDRLMLSEDGLVAVVITVDRKSGALVTSPDIITRGFIYIRDNEELMTDLRNEIKRAVAQRFKRIDIDRFKQEMKDHVTHFLYEHTNRSPIVIPVVNVVAGNGGKTNPHPEGRKWNGPNDRGPETKPQSQPQEPAKPEKTNEQMAKEQQDRFAEMRAQLLGRDQGN
ncbi:MAG: ribonuclease J [bacterium]|nr:ribonuclease J [bacterium]